MTNPENAPEAEFPNGDVELLPCPFCGEPSDYEAPSAKNWRCASVRCTNPYCCAKPHACVENSPEQVIAAWNTRAALEASSHATLEAENKRLREALEPIAKDLRELLPYLASHHFNVSVYAKLIADAEQAIGGSHLKENDR